MEQYSLTLHWFGIHGYISLERRTRTIRRIRALYIISLNTLNL